jgi:hypothetical protein
MFLLCLVIILNINNNNEVDSTKDKKFANNITIDRPSNISIGE